jgi:hypothetical protein
LKTPHYLFVPQIFVKHQTLFYILRIQKQTPRQDFCAYGTHAIVGNTANSEADDSGKHYEEKKIDL